MNTKSKNMLTALGIVLFGVSAVAGHALAQNMGDTETININATVDNTYSITITDVEFDAIAASDWTTGTTATASVAPDGSTTETAGDGWAGANPAFIVFDPTGTTVNGNIAITGAFNNTSIYVSYDNCQNLSHATETEVFVITRVWDDLATPSDYDCTNPPTIGVGTTDGAGALSFNVGVEISTEGLNDAAYGNGAYAGSVDMYLHY